jgi:hypothetical protein
MTIWAWLILGGGLAVLTSVAAALGLAATLGTISDDVTRLLEAEPYTLAPATRTRTPSPRSSDPVQVAR